MNDRIRAKEVRLIGSDGSQVGIVDIETARKMASDQALDLLLVSDDASPPVCKLVDYGQYKYEQQKKDKQAKKGHKSQVLKELKMSPKISSHDYMVRVNKGRKFLSKGYKVKLSVFFKGREMTHPELGKEVIQRYLEAIKDVGQPDNEVAFAHRSMVVILSPK